MDDRRARPTILQPVSRPPTGNRTTSNSSLLNVQPTTFASSLNPPSTNYQSTSFSATNSPSTTRPTTAASNRPSTSSSRRPSTASPERLAYVPKRGLSEMASLLDALETKLKDDGIQLDNDGEEIGVGTSKTSTTRRDFVSKELSSLVAELNMSLDPSYKYTKPSLSDDQVSYSLLHRALRELVKEKQMCASEVEDMRSRVLDKESALVADLHHSNALKDALMEKLKITESSLASAQNRISNLRRKKAVYKDSLHEEKTNGNTLLKQKLNAENRLDSANAHIASLTQTSGVYESKLQDVTEKLIDLTKLQVKLENKSNIEAAAFESKIANLSKVNAERKEGLERAAAELSDVSRQNQVLRTQLAAAQTQLNHLTQRLADRHQSDLKAMQANKRSEREREKEKDKIEPPTGVVTLVFTDVQGSTAQWEHNPEIMTLALDMHFKIMREHMNRSGGYECKTEGDAFMIAFQSPLQAVHWSMTVQEALLVADWPPALMDNEHSQEERSIDGRLLFKGLRVRIGCHTGTPQCHRDPVSKRMDYFGPMVNRAARVSGLAHGGQVVVSGRTWREIEADISGVDISHLGEHSLKGIKGKEQIVQLLPITLAGRKFPPLNTGEPKTTHFEEQSAPRKNHHTSISSVKPGVSFSVEEDENERESQQSPSRVVMPQIFARMREASQNLSEASQGDIASAVNEAEQQMKILFTELVELKENNRGLQDLVADNEDRLMAADELEAEAAEYREMVDNLKTERQQLEETVRAEQAEKEFFLRKLMEANKDLQGLSSVSSFARDIKKASELQVSDIVAMSEKEKVEALLRANSKIKSMHVRLRALQEQRTNSNDEALKAFAAQFDGERNKDSEQQEPNTPPMYKVVQQALQVGQGGLVQQLKEAQKESDKEAQQQQPQLLQQQPTSQPQPISQVQPNSSSSQLQQTPSQGFSIANHQSHASSSRLISVTSNDHYHKQISIEYEKQLQIMADRNKTLEQLVNKQTADHTAKMQSSQNHINSLLQRIADAEKSLVFASAQIKPDAEGAKKSKENEVLKAKLKDMEEELEKVTKAKDDLQTQWKELTEISGKPGSQPTNTAPGQRRRSAPAPLDVGSLMKKLKSMKEKVETLEGEKKELEAKVQEQNEKFLKKRSASPIVGSPRVAGSPRVGSPRVGSPKREELRNEKEEDTIKKTDSDKRLDTIRREESIKKEEIRQASPREERKRNTPRKETETKEVRWEIEVTEAKEPSAKEKGKTTPLTSETATKDKESEKESAKKEEEAEAARIKKLERMKEKKVIEGQLKSLESQVSNLKSENEIIIQENYRLNQLVEQLESDLRGDKKVSQPNPPKSGRRGSYVTLSPDIVDSATTTNPPKSARRGSFAGVQTTLAAPEVVEGSSMQKNTRRGSFVGSQNTLSPDVESAAPADLRKRRNSTTPSTTSLTVPSSSSASSSSSISSHPPTPTKSLLTADFNITGMSKPRRESISIAHNANPTTSSSTPDPPTFYNNILTLPPNPGISTSWNDLIFDANELDDEPLVRVRSNSDPPNLRVSFHKQQAADKKAPRKKDTFSTLTILTPLSPSTSPRGAPSSPNPSSTNPRSPSAKWTQMVSDMESELEELTALTVTEKPASTPKPLSSPKPAATPKSQFSLDTIFSKGQQYLTPILQKSKNQQQQQNTTTSGGVSLGLSGKSVG